MVSELKKFIPCTILAFFCVGVMYIDQTAVDKATAQDTLPVTSTKLKSPDETKTVDVLTIDGVNRLATSSPSSTSSTQDGPEDFSLLLYEFLTDTNGSSDLAVDGSNTPVQFSVDARAGETLVVELLKCGIAARQFRFQRFIFNQSLSNGLLFEIRSNGGLFQFEPIKRTRDFLNLFIIDVNQFRLDESRGRVNLVVIWKPQKPFKIVPQGTNGKNDFVRVTVRDDLDDYNTVFFKCNVFGYVEN